MAAVNILAFCMLALVLSLCFKEKLVDVLPMTACILVLVLYVLAFFRRLSWIDGIGILFLAAVLWLFFKRSTEDRRRLLAEGREKLLHPGVFAALLVLVGGALLVGGRIATWWDDINFWATDVKSLYALDGFAARYANAASEFGDYPPGAQLMKWWFVHLSPKQFREGLMFGGYYFMVFVFFMPYFRRLRSRNPFLLLACAACVWALPSVAEVFYCQGMCADLVMASVYGAFLAAVLDRKGHSERFYLLRLSLYLSVLVLIKSIGFLWAAFGLLFFILYHACVLRSRRKAGMPVKRGAAIRPVLFAGAGALVTSGSWFTFCLLMRRVAKLTGAAVSIAAGNTPILLPGTREKLLAAFGEAFLVWPLHRGRTPGLDFSAAGLLCIICLVVFLLYKKKLLHRGEAVLTGIFLPVCALVFYSVNLIGHLTIFATETQYLEPFSMVSSIERYGAPITVGSLSLLGFLILNRWEEKSAPEHKGLWEKTRRYVPWLLVFGFIAVSAHWQEVYTCLNGYRAKLPEEQAVRNDMITIQSERFLKRIGREQVSSGMRVLYLKSSEENQWVKNAYIAFEASPVSLILGGVDAAGMGSADLQSVMDASHAAYFYADHMEAGEEKLLAPFADNYQPETLYRILWKNGAARLEPVD